MKPGFSAAARQVAGQNAVQFSLGAMGFFVLFVAAIFLTRKVRAKKYIHLPEDDVEVSFIGSPPRVPLLSSL